ncbi:MAG: T4 RnlA family RNA ligase [Nitrospirae bacterium]|nr:T4 RnlA family RNA ligase [Nitrospirota bacterium]
MQTLAGYFAEHNLFDETTLREHGRARGVRVATSPRFPHLRLLEYGTLVQIEKIPWDLFNRRCRGIVVDLERKRLLAFPFHKFFNLGEKPETAVNRLLELGTFTATEKLDGSMGILFYDEASGRFHITTRGSFDSTQALWSSERIPASVQDTNLVEAYTLIFEIIAYRVRGLDNIIDYRKKGLAEGLYLVGMRHRISETLLPHAELFRFAKARGLPTPRVHAFASLDACTSHAKTLDWMDEGFVLEFRDGTLVKVKSPEYLRVHRFVSGYSDRRVLEALRDGKSDIMLAGVPEEYRGPVEADFEKWRRKALDLRNEAYAQLARAPQGDRKALALWCNEHVAHHLIPFVFLALDNRLTLDGLYGYLLKGLGPGETDRRNLARGSRPADSGEPPEG